MRRLPAALLKRLERVEAMRGENRPRADFPPILPIDEWEALAVASQEELVFLTREYIDDEPVRQQQDNRQAEHTKANREHQDQIDARATDYLKHKRQQVRRMTTR